MLIALAQRYSPRADEIRSTAWCSRSRFCSTIVVAILLSFAPTLGQGRLAARVAHGGCEPLERRRAAPASAADAGRRADRGVGDPADRRRTAHAHDACRLSDVDTGLTSETVLTMEVPIAIHGSRSDADARAMYERMRLAARAHPGREGGGPRLDDAASLRRSSSSTSRPSAVRSRR